MIRPRRHRRPGLGDPPAPQGLGGHGHLAGFTDPMVDCKFCKNRFRADQLDIATCGQKPSKRPGEGPDCELTEAASST